MLRAILGQMGSAASVVMRGDDTGALDAPVHADGACALRREELALPGLEAGNRMVRGRARVDARLFFRSGAGRIGNPLAVTLESAGRGFRS